MDRLIAANTVPLAGADTAPTAGTPQYATGGNPAAGIPQTVWPAYQYNALQEEILAVIVAAGEAPDRTNLKQLLGAIQALIAADVTFGISGSAWWIRFSVPQAISPSGLFYLQGGSGVTPSNGQGVVNFPVAFPTHCIGVVVGTTGATSQGTMVSGGLDFSSQVIAGIYNNTYCPILAINPAGAGGNGGQTAYSWLAFGN